MKLEIVGATKKSCRHLCDHDIAPGDRNCNDSRGIGIKYISKNQGKKWNNQCNSN